MIADEYYKKWQWSHRTTVQLSPLVMYKSSNLPPPDAILHFPLARLKWTELRNVHCQSTILISTVWSSPHTSYGQRPNKFILTLSFFPSNIYTEAIFLFFRFALQRIIKSASTPISLCGIVSRLRRQDLHHGPCSNFDVQNSINIPWNLLFKLN
jgi:hypothetical protein